ncbi:hypothetical protein ACHAXT_005468 [Thalassiosira profunda]
MKVAASIILAPLLAREALAFVPSSPPVQRPAVATALHAEAPRGKAAAVAASSALLAGSISLLSSTPAFAAIDEFSLPSYDSSKGTSLIDLNSEVESVNKKTMAKAKAKREFVDTSAEKLEADQLRKAEKDGGSLLDSMLGSAESERKAAIEAEKAETRANRWNTF